MLFSLDFFETDDIFFLSFFLLLASYLTSLDLPVIIEILQHNTNSWVWIDKFFCL